MEKKTKSELQVRNREIQDRMSALNDCAVAAKREFTAEEQQEWDALSREKILNNNMLKDMFNDEELAKNRETVSKGEQMREYLKAVRNNKADREILLAPSGANTTANIEASGAINLTVHEIIPTLHEGLGLPESLRIVTGVTGNEVWPVSVNDVEMEEVGEVDALNDQVLNFANITPSQRRVGLTVPVSNMAIDNAAFDLMAFVSEKFTIALRKYLAEKVYSQAAWSGIKGPFSGLTPKTDKINIAHGAYRAILKAVAEFSDEGFFDGDVTLIMDRETEAELKATPKIEGAAAGFVIENGRCAGYPYIVTHYINTALSGSPAALAPTNDKYIGIGYFQWLALQQHGEVRLSIDATSAAVAKKGVTQITINTAWSLTDLSIYINGGSPTGSPVTYPTKAFALYEVEYNSASDF